MTRSTIRRDCFCPTRKCFQRRKYCNPNLPLCWLEKMDSMHRWTRTELNQVRHALSKGAFTSLNNDRLIKFCLSPFRNACISASLLWRSTFVTTLHLKKARDCFFASMRKITRRAARRCHANDCDTCVSWSASTDARHAVS